MESVALTYFTDLQAITVEAIAERIIPANGTDAGATVAGVVYYIDRSISGFSSNLQRVYRLGLRELERYCEQRYSAQFHEIDNEKQDATIRDISGRRFCTLPVPLRLRYSPSRLWNKAPKPALTSSAIQQQCSTKNFFVACSRLFVNTPSRVTFATRSTGETVALSAGSWWDSPEHSGATPQSR